MSRYCRCAVLFIAAFAVSAAFSQQQVTPAQIDQGKTEIAKDPAGARKQIDANPQLMDKLTPSQRAEVLQAIQDAERTKVSEASSSKEAATTETPTETKTEEQAGPETKTEDAQEEAPAEPKTEEEIAVDDQDRGGRAAKAAPRETYGRRLFGQVFLHPSYVEIPDDYVIAQGDEILLRFWGSFNQERKYLIGKDGYVFIEPLKRQAYLTGMTFGALRKMVERVSDASPGVEGDVRVVNAHPIYVHVSGSAAKPGTVSAPAYYTFWQFLMLSKGPSANGSVRDIRVMRRGREITRVDIYDFLRSGRKPIVGLQNEDLIFFGEAKKNVLIGGLVRKPGVYELRENEKLGDIVALAGGLAAGTSAPGVQIQRTTDLTEKSRTGFPYRLIEVDLARPGWEKTEIKDNDIVIPRTLNAQFANDISISGAAIAVPGRYSLPDRLWSIADLIKQAGGLISGAYRMADLVRLNPDGSRTLMSIDLFNNALLQTLYLKPQDNLMTYGEAEFTDRATVSISGSVRKPITIQYADSLTIADLVRQSRGLLPNTYRIADLVRRNKDRKTQTLVRIDLTDSAGLKSMRLEPFDNLLTYNNADFIDVATVRSRGFVRVPFDDQYSDSLTLADVLRRSRGQRESALPYVYIKSADSLDNITYHRYSIVDPAAAANIKINKRDEVLFFDYHAFNGKLPITVLAYNREPLVLQYSPDLTLEVIIHELGGMDQFLDSTHIEICVPDYRDAVTYAVLRTDTLNARTSGQRGLIPEGSIVFFRRDPDKDAARYVTISGEVLRPGTYPLLRRNSRLSELFKAAGGLSERGNKGAITIARDGKTVPVEVGGGRLSFVNNWVLNGGDIITVGRNDYSVEVAGAVFDPRIVAYHPGYTCKDYVKKSAGGALDTADFGKTYVQYPNGITRKGHTGWCVFSSTAAVYPGSRVVVPMKPYVAPPRENTEKTDWTKPISIISGTLLSIVTLLVIANQLK